MKTMSTEEDEEKLNYEVEIKELVKRVFEKAQKDSMGISKNAWGNYIEENSKLGSKTFIRMYDRYILGDKNQSVPSMFSLNAAAEFIGHKTFADFCREVFPKQNLIPKREYKKKETKERTSSISKRKFKNTIAGIGITAVLGLGSYLGISAYNKPQCMYWSEKQYEAIHCDENINPNVAIIQID